MGEGHGFTSPAGWLDALNHVSQVSYILEGRRVYILNTFPVVFLYQAFIELLTYPFISYQRFNVYSIRSIPFCFLYPVTCLSYFYVWSNGSLSVRNFLPLFFSAYLNYLAMSFLPATSMFIVGIGMIMKQLK